MNGLEALSLLPFVPSGKNYDASRRLFTDLGFEETWERDGYAGFRNGEAQFILQRFDDESNPKQYPAGPRERHQRLVFHAKPDFVRTDRRIQPGQPPIRMLIQFRCSAHPPVDPFP